METKLEAGPCPPQVPLVPGRDGIKQLLEWFGMCWFWQNENSEEKQILEKDIYIDFSFRFLILF